MVYIGGVSQLIDSHTNMVKCEKKIQLTFGISPDLFCLIKICHLYNAFNLLFSVLTRRELVMDLYLLS
jgi:hypothetical protein